MPRRVLFPPIVRALAVLALVLGGMGVTTAARAEVLLNVGSFTIYGANGGGIDDWQTFAIDATGYENIEVSFDWVPLCSAGCGSGTEGNDKFYVYAGVIELHPTGGFSMYSAGLSRTFDPEIVSEVADSPFDLAFAVGTTTRGENVAVGDLLVTGTPIGPAIPEPGSALLMAAAAAGLARVRSRRRRPRPVA